MSKTVSIAVDGPAGVGKSTIAKALARKLGFTYVDSGAMYRAVTLFALEQGIPIAAEYQPELLATAAGADFTFDFVQEELRIFHGKRDITEIIRSREVTAMVSHLAALPEIRRGLANLQRQIAQSANVVMEGRDIGTVVLPQADFKFYLTATPAVRARRRYDELVALGRRVAYEEILAGIEERDRLDSTRACSPLRKAADAVELDTSHLSIQAVVDQIMAKVNHFCHVGQNDI